jgi:hypothetical protein
MSARLPLFFLLLFCYGAFFSLQETHFSESRQQLAHPLPPIIQKIALGYLRQLGGEMQFIKASVFYGGVKPGRDPLEYADPLAHYFTAAASLHPPFVDTYFVCQGILPFINNDYARYANTVLAQGMTALPDNWMLAFFAGFNHFYYLDEPLEAARLFHLAAAKPNAPIMLEHLANILSAEGGNIYAALIGLQGMYATEEDEQVKRRYAEEIAAFEKAVTVLNAIQRHEKMKGTPPAALADLVPEYLPTIPDVGPIFRLEWKPPHLGVVRVAKKKSGRG